MGAGGAIIKGKGDRVRPTLCLNMRVVRSLHLGYMGILGYVVDTRTRKMKTIAEVHLFHMHFSGIPPEGWVDFRIVLVPGVNLISKAPYQLAPPKMRWLSKKLLEPLDKRFI